MIDPKELSFRQRRFMAIAEASRTDAAFWDERTALKAQRAARRDEVLALLEVLATTGDLEAFREGFDAWSRRPGYATMAGFNGGMFLNQVVQGTPDLPGLAPQLVGWLSPPTDDRDAEAKVDGFIEHVNVIRKGAQPAPKRALFFASFFWHLRDARTWPCLWPSAEKALLDLGWLDPLPVSGAGYLRFAEVARSLDAEGAFEDVTLWFSQHSWLGLDTSLLERLARASELKDVLRSDGADEEATDTARRNIAAVLADLKLLGTAGEEAVSEAVGRALQRQTAKPQWAPGVYRDDAWVDWRPTASPGFTWAPSIRVYAAPQGVLVGLYPGRKATGWGGKARAALAPLVPEGLSIIDLSGYGAGVPAAPPSSAADTGGTPDGEPSSTSEFVVGRWYDAADVLGRPGFLDDVVAVAAQLQPALDKVTALAGAEEQEPAAEVDRRTAQIDPALKELFQLFLEETGYPSTRDQEMDGYRKGFLEVLRPDALPELEVAELRKIYNSNRWGFPGNQSVLNQTLRDASPALVDRVVETLFDLLWSDDPFEDRIDRCLDPSRAIKGMGESVLVKLLAVCHPERWLPIFPVRGDNGKVAILEAMGEEVPATSLSRGARQVEANDRLRAHLEPLLPGDPWGQMVFGYWLRDRAAQQVEVDPLDQVVDDCYLPDRTFVDELVALLADKGQIVLYGPPGTGKTYIARKLAAALAGTDDLQRFVQFHPSTSYEDFFEGYRPSADDKGNLLYRLEPGPFAALADHALADPRLHVLVIDELNRANIPKVFGELLFLLEYRDQSVVPLYRPEGFTLPENLWVIATMNTADRSIASIDAALRRRFHFVPVFPDDGPMAGILERYLEDKGGEVRWAQLVDMVNAELRERLGNGDLLIGPSHFMKANLDEGEMERIWRYNIDPLVEDLFYGDQEAIQLFRWPKVLQRAKREAAPTPDALEEVALGEPPEPEVTAPAPSVDDGGEPQQGDDAGSSSMASA